MSDLDDRLAEEIKRAESRAAADGRSDVADYLRLRSENDAIRTAAVQSLIDSVIQLASSDDLHKYRVTIERIEPHRFPHGSSTMVGSALEVRQGLRCVTFEAGWVRTPSDGIMTRSALALARIFHFGMPSHTDEFRLMRIEAQSFWIRDDGTKLDDSHIRRHLEVLVSG